MSQPKPSLDTDAEAAINRVLLAEREARAAMEACDRQASEIVQEAHERGLRIRERAEARIQRWHTHSEERTVRQIAELKIRAEQIQGSPIVEPEPDPALAVALETLCVEIIGR